jgi:hypothetical protein
MPPNDFETLEVLSITVTFSDLEAIPKGSQRGRWEMA